jgi:hypothetical protein
MTTHRFRAFMVAHIPPGVLSESSRQLMVLIMEA